MTERVVQAGAFREEPFLLVDVGARGGIEGYWKVFGDDIKVLAFEVDADECARLNAEAVNPQIRYFPFAVDRVVGTRAVLF